GGIDYRRETIRQAGVYLTPHGKKSERSLGQLFERLTSEAGELSDPIIVNGRELDIPLAADGVAMIGFNDLCGQALGPGDYLAVAARYHTLLLYDIPQMGPENRNEAKRFVTLIDALYENGVNLVCSAAASPSELYTQGDGSFEFERTASRLMEMQSEEYLGRVQAA
ncbi:MAG: cell division protein ZapE, partial [Rhodospirillales bacterium]|nr:cell division protein ZapE [Rhodospirillales bacterium]